MDLRFPIGKFARPTTWTEGDRSTAIAALASLPSELAAAVAGMTDAQLDTPYRPDGWTVRQLVHHVADSHANMYTRLRLALTETEPTIKPYAEAEWAKLLDARTQPVGVSLAMLDALHARTVALLKSLAPAEFARAFRHPETGAQTIDSLIALYAWHGRHHTAHVTGLRAREGWA